jgi:hypothetical protein
MDFAPEYYVQSYNTGGGSLVPRRQTLGLLRGTATWGLIALWDLIKATALVRVYYLLILEQYHGNISEKHHGNISSNDRSGATAVA